MNYARSNCPEDRRAHPKIGDRKVWCSQFCQCFGGSYDIDQLAYECFIRTFRYTHHHSSLSSAELFAPSAPLPLKQLSSIVERLTYTATTELLLPPAQITMRHISHASARSEPESNTPSNPISTFPSDNRFNTEIAMRSSRAS